MTMTVHNYRPRQFHRTLNGENPSTGYRDMGSASWAAARPPARTVMTIPLQPEGLMGNEIEGQCQSSPKLTGILTVLRCILGSNLEILSWIGGERWHGQAQNMVIFYF